MSRSDESNYEQPDVQPFLCFVCGHRIRSVKLEWARATPTSPIYGLHGGCAARIARGDLRLKWLDGSPQVGDNDGS